MSEAKQSQSASRLRNQNEILIEKSDKALIKSNQNKKTQISSRMSWFIRFGAIQLKAKFALANLIKR